MAMCRPLIRIRDLNKQEIFCMLVGYCCLVYAGSVIPERISVSPTDSVGAHVFFYKRNFKPSEIHEDTLVVVPLYTRIRPDCWPCQVVKYVKCDSGDKLEATHRGEFFCNNVYLGRAKTHSREGTPVERFEFDGIIPEGKFFAMGTCVDSYDSRYVGLEDKRDIKAVAVPLF